ncbi:NNMT/PNMT/TEMT family class I SAM-dependent methyltransferase [Mesorhizobium sp. YC-39]|uniref:guanitoxin biosynthesis pre-guanitoxin forming N-methyltransferase GntF n=1 Tax=unclassified Mesorhizobium TaxID=325217 RepID=UPI0021E8A23F|nr:MULTISPECIES: guanitoxin biosynthesis pre-guanitoxin forming N-methyltransferase GntF [unclassified Mesorhizobium]MCV3209280.1 NNMT/PNMT/TEMT family class I SAM-dependent methyltransferase [Mesorhizobium sp. YC-2]MCV3231370.1 NNMT/PNMT/TEMT family class I SAM-dependent methyltransferase [Mesorhizobium sp. YC-39]
MLARDSLGAIRPVTQLKRWSATLVANAVSTYALDTASTVSGVLLVASGVFSGTGFQTAVVLLGVSYVLWGYGLSSSLTANWRLLEATGTSTSLLSKLAYDLGRTRRAGTRQLLSAAGYVAFELAKESPYYIGAFGLAFASDLVSGEEALVFLAGANIGAAAYEYGLGWSTRILLQRAEDGGYASFEKEWSPADYLAGYYGAIDADEHHTIAFFTEAARRMPADEPALVFGVGPTLHHVFPLASRASEIHLGDFLRCNLDEIAGWIRKDEGAHDWQPFVSYTLQCEGVADPTHADILDREQLTRAGITRLLEVDIRNDRPLGNVEARYATVLSAYCADSATADLGDWQTYMRRIVGLVRPGGTLLIAALGQTQGYFVGAKAFPSPFLDGTDMEDMLRDYFPEAELTIRLVPVPECAAHGYSSIILAAGHRKAGDSAVADLRGSPLG